MLKIHALQKEQWINDKKIIQRIHVYNIWQHNFSGTNFSPPTYTMSRIQVPLARYTLHFSNFSSVFCQLICLFFSVTFQIPIYCLCIEVALFLNLIHILASECSVLNQRRFLALHTWFRPIHKVVDKNWPCV